MSVVTLPIFRTRKHVGEIRHLMIDACELMSGDVADLNSQSSRQITELWLMAAKASVFHPQVLHNAKVTKDELVNYCSEVGLRQRTLDAFFTNLSITDAQWYQEIVERRHGFIIKVIVGYRSAMQLAQDHGFLSEVIDAEQRAMRRFAFGHTATR
jgi:hypothetical protein